MKYFNLLAFTILTIGINSTNLHAFQLSNISGKQSLLIVEGAQNKTRKTRFTLDFSINKKLSQKIDFLFRSKTYFEAGSSSALYANIAGVDQFSPKTVLNVYNSKLRFKTDYNIDFEAGMINQDWIENSLFLDHIAFFAVKETFHFTLAYFDFKFFAEQAVATNIDLSSRLGSVEGGTPFLFLYGTQLQNQSDFLDFKLIVAGFIFKDISSTVAHSSRFFGNSISGTSTTDSRFLYKYKGITLSSNLAFDFDFIYNPIIKFRYLYNHSAPNQRNNGYSIQAGIRDEITIVYAERFYNESDTTIAYYNSPWNGNNNSQGFGIGFETTISTLKFEVNYRKLTPIEKNLYVVNTQMGSFHLKFKL